MINQLSNSGMGGGGVGECDGQESEFVDIIEGEGRDHLYATL